VKILREAVEPVQEKYLRIELEKSLKIAVHQNLVRMLGLCWSKRYIAMELCPETERLDVILRMPDSIWNNSRHGLQFARDICSGLEFLHVIFFF
jgi:hypothetical protein